MTEEWRFQKYVPLHCHTDSSILDGYQKPYEYADLCEKLHVKAAAITDHGTCSGQEPFDRRIIEKGYHFKPIFGEEAYLVDDVDNVMSDRPARDRKGNIKIDKETGEPEMAKQKPSDFNHGCIWAKTNEGLANLWTLSTLSYTKGMYYKPRIDMKMLKQYGKGLFVSDGCMLSAVSRAIVADDFSKAEAWLNKLIEAVGKDNVLMELHTWQFTDEKYSKDWKTFEYDELKDLIARLRACNIVLKSMEDLDNARKEVESFGKSLTDEQKKQKAAFAQYDAEINNWNLNQNMYKTNKGKVELARKLGLRLIAVNDAHYGPREDYIWHELEWATTTGKGAEYDDDKTGGRGETAAWVMNDEEVKYWLMKSGLSEEIADEAIDNTGWVADHCNAVMERGMHPPRFESTREKDEELFDKTVVEGIKELVPKDRNTFKQYMDRVNLESELIKKCDLCGYFNTVADYANFVRAEDPDGEKYGIVGKHASLLGPSRGSAGGSLVCYLMHITNLDSIKFDLYFERFLTAGRVISKVHLTFDDGEEKVFEPSDVVKTEYGDKASWQCLTENWNTEFGKIVSTRFDFKDCPDIDLDFEARVIPQLNAYLKKRYGEYNFCQIGTFQTLKMPMAVKDLGKVKGMTPQETQDIVNRMENAGWPKGAYMRDYTFEDMMNCVNKDEELKKIQEETGLFDEVWHWGERYRGEGIHASGYVISKESMLGKLPLRMKDGKLITQFEHDGIASLGFIKYDILKLASLGTIREVYERVNHKMDVKDIYRIMRDEKLLSNADIWKSTWQGDTLGIFQMDTPLGMKTSINSRMASLRDAGMLSAVDRPGMVRSGLINEFYKVRQGIDPVNHYHPLIDKVLDETSGFVVYQEQIMFLYSILCNMTLEETDGVRKVFTKKQTWNVEKMKTLLHDYCMSRKDFIDNVPDKYSSPEECFDDMWLGLSRTAEYSFNKSHCLSGYETVRLDTGEVITLSELYKRYSRGEDLNVLQMLPDGTVAPGHIAEVIDSGLKEVLTITLEDKTVIRATPEHRFLTTRGYVAVKDFIDGEELIVDKSNSYARTSLSEAMKKTQSMMTHEQRCIHQQNVQKLHPDRFKKAQIASQEALKKLRQDKNWMEKYCKAVSEGQKEYWSKIEDKKNARNWSGWTFQHSWDEDRVKEHYREQAKKVSAFYKNVSDEWVKSWTGKIKATKRANGTTNFGYPTKLSDGKLCDSRFEAEVGQYLLDRGIEFEVHKVIKTADGHRRMTDFYVDGLYIECDGLYRGEQYFKDKKYGDDLPFVVLYPDSWKYVIDQMLMSNHISNGVRVKSVEKKPLPGRWHKTYCRTYDIVMDDHCPANFIVNGIVSHNSLGYGMITSIEQYFKWKYPSEFITASLNTDPGAVEFLTYAKVHGLKIAPPNVNKSKQNYELQDGVIYMPLSTVKGVGPSAVEEIIANGPYDSFDDYVQKTSGRGGRKKNVMESLISVGAFDGVDERDRFQLMVAWKKSRSEDYPTRNTWKSPRVRGKIEQNLLGISLSYDPLFDNKEWIEKQGVTSLGELQKTDVGDFVCIPGQVTSIRKHQAKNGEMAWLTVKLLFHDEVTLTMFATAWSKYKDLISTNVIAAFNCKRTDDWNGKQSYVAFSAKANLEGEE